MYDVIFKIQFQRALILNKSDNYKKLADNYFEFLAEYFPVMCASDEFDFLPRAESACKYYDKLDKFESSNIEEAIDKLKGFRKRFAATSDDAGDLDRFIDLKLLQSNVAGILIELENKRSWQYNPLMYLKIAFIGLDHALIKPAGEPKEIQERALARLSSIPDILKHGMDNIQSVPETYYQASMLMAGDCKQYLNELGNDVSKIFGDHHDAAAGTKTAGALEDFNRFLKSISPEPDKRFAVSTLETSLTDHFLSSHSPEEIYVIARGEWQEILGQLKNLQIHIDPNKTWDQLYHDYTPSKTQKEEIIALYGDEINRLRRFFSQNGFDEELLSAPIEIAYTPTYLKSVRSSASFAAAFSRDPQEKSYFYISTQFPRHNSEETDHHLQQRLNREYKMLTAHETIPGHHFLDSFRRKLKNPIRRQIESPLFYEGWASYAESMLIEYGYLSNPLEELVSYKRKLWRSARCQIDVGLTIGKLSENKAVDLLQICGFASAEAKRQLDRFRLNPGYQLCYGYGSYEFKQLKKKYGHFLEGKEFYSFLLEGGELPFHLIEKRFENLHRK
jgi:uncharacterized protein (DUF885 family)